VIGGIGGLTAVLSLLRTEFEVDVYEQAPELKRGRWRHQYGAERGSRLAPARPSELVRYPVD
jgi:2-polyprenyl-6-methoxyphenol hydroxylase-like FAD-dependent oxidoreductase